MLALSSCDAQASLVGQGLLILGCAEPRLQSAKAQYVQHVGSLISIRAALLLVPGPGIPVSCTRRQLLNYWTTREDPWLFFFIFYLT